MIIIKVLANKHSLFVKLQTSCCCLLNNVVIVVVGFWCCFITTSVCKYFIAFSLVVLNIFGLLLFIRRPADVKKNHSHFFLQKLLGFFVILFLFRILTLGNFVYLLLHFYFRFFPAIFKQFLSSSSVVFFVFLLLFILVCFHICLLFMYVCVQIHLQMYICSTKSGKHF